MRKINPSKTVTCTTSRQLTQYQEAKYLHFVVLMVKLYYTIIIIIFFNNNAIGCTNGDMRLKGESTDEGIVELCVSGSWRSIGINQWDNTDANVVCQSLYSDKKCMYHNITLD